ncbi:glycosyltransferase family 2 protein [Actinoplanes sichuanensis]|uniref:Glycosyltransferase n=1 Tax=Actinoplanes sichuanensis TaxID=512349 RepID=A0ABW4AIB8_9ACTN|nr:glycosyltransferase [Actinoplanes sichuanensis]
MSVVIPLTTVGRLPLLFAGLPPVGEIIVVVGPDEDTVLPLPRAARVIRQTRYGTGNAIACGVAAATGDVIVTLPGDGSCDPAHLPHLVEALATSAGRPFPTADPAAPTVRADVVEGVRTARRTDLFLLWFMSVLLGCRPSGAGTGFRAFRRAHADRLGLPRVAGTDPVRGDGRDVEVLLAARSRRAGLRVAEVPVGFYPQRGGTALPAGLAAIVRERLALRRDGHPGATPDSIVVLTGGTSARAATSVSTGPIPAPLFVGPNRRAATPPATGLTRRPPAPSGLGPARRNATSSGTGPARREPASSGTGPVRGDSAAVFSVPAQRDGASFFAGTVNAPRKPGADHRPTDPALRRWPAPNRSAATNPDHPNSAGIGMTDRRRGADRRGPERRRTDPTPDRRASTGRPGNDRPNTDSPHRRRWRDGQNDLNLGRRPDLRVINGEGTGSGGSRGHLRSV